MKKVLFTSLLVSVLPLIIINNVSQTYFSNNNSHNLVENKQSTSNANISFDLNNNVKKILKELEIYKKTTNNNLIDNTFYQNFNNYLITKTINQKNINNFYNDGINRFDSYWWGFKWNITWNGLSGFIDKKSDLQIGTVVTALWSWMAIYAPGMITALEATAGVAGVAIVQVAGCILGSQIWNKKGIVIRMLWIGVLTGCWDQ